MARLARLLRLLVPVATVALAAASSAHGTSSVSLAGGIATFTAGSGDANSLTVSVEAPDVVFQDIHAITESSGSCTGNGTSTVRCADTAVASIVVDLGDQNDALTIESTGNNPVSSGAGSGDDAIILGTSSTPIYLTEITSLLTLDGGSGTDSLTLRDIGDSSDDILTLTATSLGAGAFDTFFGGGGSATHTGVESITVNAGSGDSNISILATSASTSTTLDAGGGDDIVQVSSNGTGASGDLDGLLGALTILGGAGANALLVSDADAPAANSATLTATTIAGLAPVSLSYTATGTWGGGLVIRGSGHADTFAITSTSAGATTDVRTLGGDDTIRVSSDGTGATGSLAALAGDLAIDVGAGSNTIAISDAAEATPGANAAVTASSTAIAGLAGPGGGSNIALAASGGTVAALTLIGSNSASVAEGYTISDVPGPFTLALGAGHDGVTLQGTAHATTLNAGAGNDTLSLGSSGAGLGDITTPVALDAAGGADTLTLDDAADPSADIVALGATTVSTEPGNSLFGTGGSLTYAGLEQLTLELGSGRDALTITATQAGTKTTVNTGSGDDIVSVPGASSSLETVVSPLSLDGGLGFNMLLLDDSADTTGDLLEMSETGIGQRPEDTLFGPGGSLGYANFTLLTLILGSGPDTVLLTGAPAGTLSSGAGDDTIELANGSSFTGALDAGDGTDTLSYESVRTPVSVDLDIGAAHATSGVQGFENVIGGRAADELKGRRDEPSELIGGKGNDSLAGGTANDRLDGGPGNDVVDGGKGNDTYILGGGRDRVIDRGGKDTIDFSEARKGIKINLSKTGKKQQRLGRGVGRVRLQAAIENVTGSRYKDRLVGNLLRNVLRGGGGNDALTGAAGNDVLIGGAGMDRVLEAADKHFKLSTRRLTGRGVDRLRSVERATIAGGPSANRINARSFKGKVILRGGAGDDTITGGRGADLLLGEDGDDTLPGGNGRDQLIAGPGNDVLFVKDGATDIVDAGIG